MSETISKLQPHRTMHLRGADGFGAAASLHSASASGFTLSGVFRDRSDFAVLYLYDADNVFENRAMRYLPDFAFDGVTLDFDLAATGVQPLDSLRYQSVDWGAIDYFDTAGNRGSKQLGSSITAYTNRANPVAQWTIACPNGTASAGDHVLLKFQNYVWEFWAQGGETPAQVAAALSTAINGAAWQAGAPAMLTAAVNGAVVSIIANGCQFTTSVDCPSGAILNFASNLGTGIVQGMLVCGTNIAPGSRIQAKTANSITLTKNVLGDVPAGTMLTFHYGCATDGQVGVYALQNHSTTTISPLGSQNIAGVPMATSADTAAGNVLHFAAAANLWAGMLVSHPMVAANTYIQSISGGDVTLTNNVLGDIAAASTVTFGAAQNGSIHLHVDFSAPGLAAVRQMWLTLAPLISPSGAAYSSTEWSAVFSNWTVADPNGRCPLSISGPGSVLVDSRDAWTSYAGSGWALETGYFHLGFGKCSATPGDSVTVKYWCQFTHDLYLGAAFFTNMGQVQVAISSGGVVMDTPSQDLYLAVDSQISSRRKVGSSLAAGAYTVTITVLATKNAASTGTQFVFDYLEAVVPTAAIPDPATTYPSVSAALDYDTDATYKMSPARVLWGLQKLGLQGPVDEYLGVFWWAQRTRVGGSVGSLTVTFSGWSGISGGADAWFQFGGSSYNPSDPAGTQIGIYVEQEDTDASLAAQFANYINSMFVGVVASAAGAVLTIACASFAYSFTFFVHGDSGGTLTVAGALGTGVEGTWEVDDTISPAINRAAADWHADLYTCAQALGMQIVTALSMEVVNPPDNPPSAVWAARFADGTPVQTDTGFASLKSTQCVFSAAVRAYQTAAYVQLAQMQAAAGLTPWLQFGEFLWWFFGRVQGLAVGYASWTAPISIGTAQPHGRATGERVIIAGIQGNTAANGAWPITVTDPTHFTLNGSSGNGNYVAGTGTVNGGGMAYYDADTTAGAQAALGRALAMFYTQDDDPSVNGGADAAFLAGRLKAHIDAIRAAVLAVVPSAKFELLWPYDVNYPSCYYTNDMPWPQGGRLNHAVNLPGAYLAEAGSGLDRFKVEGLSWGATYRNLAKAMETVAFPWTIGSWPKAACCCLVPWFNGGCPWQKEYLYALGLGVPVVLWALDHFGLFNWPAGLPAHAPRSTSVSV